MKRLLNGAFRGLSVSSSWMSVLRHDPVAWPLSVLPLVSAASVPGAATPPSPTSDSEEHGEKPPTGHAATRSADWRHADGRKHARPRRRLFAANGFDE